MLAGVERVGSRETLALARLFGRVIQAATEEDERFHRLCQPQSSGRQLKPVLVAKLAGLLEQPTTTRAAAQVVGGQRRQPAAQWTEPLTARLVHRRVPGRRLRSRPVELAANAVHRQIAQLPIALTLWTVACQQVLDGRLREAPMPAWRPERPHVAVVGPTPQRGLVYAEQAAGLTQREPAMSFIQNA